MNNKKKVTVIGLGYIGLPTAVLLTQNGYIVSGVDTNTEIVNLVNEGKSHINEPELTKALEKAVIDKKLQAFCEIQEGDIFIICVPTPLLEIENRKIPEMRFVEESLKMISQKVKENNFIILESTSPVGTTKIISKAISEMNNINISNINIGYCPERVLPGDIMNELITNDRIVGGISEKSTREIANFYRTFVRGNVYETNAETAEICKLAENSYRDVNIAFANEIEMLCNDFKVDSRELISLANKHPRVSILDPGIGVGGHCIAVDPHFLISQNPENSELINMARLVNKKQTRLVIEDIDKRIRLIKNKKNLPLKITVLGLAYKPDVGDIRESPAMQIYNQLKQSEDYIMAVDPLLSNLKNIKLFTLSEAIGISDLVICLVKHSYFKEELNKKIIGESNYIDYCNLI